MGAASRIKKSEVSRICAGPAARVAAFCNRILAHAVFPDVSSDAICVHVRDDAPGQVDLARQCAPLAEWDGMVATKLSKPANS
jgi:transposase-like protein